MSATAPIVVAKVQQREGIYDEDKDLHGSDEEEDDDCLQVWLGGLSPSDLAWDVDDDEKEGPHVDGPVVSAEEENGTKDGSVTSSLLHQTQSARKAAVVLPPEALQGSSSSLSSTAAPWYSLAYSVESGQQSHPQQRAPPVCIVDLSAQGRGNALVATRRLRAGQVIYTERAAVATQMPRASVRACQCCFRSLEPASACRLSTMSSSGISNDELLPMPDLWPIPEMEFVEPLPYTGTGCSTMEAVHDAVADDSMDKLQHDTYGRVQCPACSSWFCSRYCHEMFIRQLGSCCVMSRAMLQVQALYVTDHDSTDKTSSACATAVTEMPSAIPLVIRMFALSLRARRMSNQADAAPTILDGLCGEASDAYKLELDALEPVYAILQQVWQLTMDEAVTFDVQFFSALAAKAARNGFCIRTQSPFTAYYSALLRTCVAGRGSSQHEALKRRVARALGSTSGDLERGMDRAVENVVCPEIVALFPLTARINHACSGSGSDKDDDCDCNAEVRSQEFVDCHIDVVARRDIECGEEITISYIYCGRKTKYRRRRELEARYLFLCECTKCKEES